MLSELCNKCGAELLTWLECQDEECESCSDDADTELLAGELDKLVEAVLNKDGPNAHPDSMFAMKYSDKF